MNIPRLRELATFVSNFDNDSNFRFDMEVWHLTSECGTTACAAGWACRLFGKTPEKRAIEMSHYGWADDIKKTAAEILDLTPDEAEDLFFKDNWCEVARKQSSDIDGFTIQVERMIRRSP